jgi:hypothetical protein
MKNPVEEKVPVAVKPGLARVSLKRQHERPDRTLPVIRLIGFHSLK